MQVWESERRIAVLGIGGDYSRRALGVVVRGRGVLCGGRFG
eukprot:COSAG01_NODE_7067_length_3368_cov_12.018748_3_plen_41_part_00